ncbi:MAG: energy-coupled thiamine transporter ThiT [Clostridia bacterium]|nr:energy-coupled thiamine transporter ThiT [Clostridia bacterium]
MNQKTKTLTEIAMTVALAVICSFIKVWEMPQGGSVSLTMIPLFILAYRRGAFSAIIAGGIYGLLSALLAGVLYHPMSLLLDYVIAFGLLGLSGLFPKKAWGVAFGTTVGVIGRFISSYLSGAILFAEYAPVGQSPWLYSFIYQITYLLPELLITLAVMMLLYAKAKKFLFGLLP